MKLQNVKDRLRNSKFLRILYAKLLSRGNSFNLKGNNNILDTAGAILKKCSLQVVGNNNLISIDVGCYLEGVKIFLQGDNLKLKIGRSVFIGQGSVLWMENSDGLIEIGEFTSIEKVAIAVAEGKKIIIGKDCLVSYEVDIRCSDSHAIFDQEKKCRINPAANIEIGNHVWLGAKCLILKGVTIGDGSIIGAGSVVTKSVEPNSVAAGNPAKVVRSDIVWTRSRSDSFPE
ncbi:MULTISPECIES: acyltransferase [unclassified Nodularia (in: cyanobacteria)]|uniref:acyltransferase n=1 Tax=unclassified Nodularia (in: cyanobacteria) TaxID=2656917 RepID=UPI0023DF1809|nr:MULTISPECIES: acyltransferase [unclassified Nodularia (in: cyanobacteria)]